MAEEEEVLFFEDKHVEKGVKVKEEEREDEIVDFASAAATDKQEEDEEKEEEEDQPQQRDDSAAATTEQEENKPKKKQQKKTEVDETKANEEQQQDETEITEELFPELKGVEAEERRKLEETKKEKKKVKLRVDGNDGRPAWVDSDDEEQEINIGTGKKMLKKLRTMQERRQMKEEKKLAVEEHYQTGEYIELEGVTVSGSDYQQRLRKQMASTMAQATNVDWARPKKRKAPKHHDDSDSDDGEQGEEEEEVKDVEFLTSGKRFLRQGSRMLNAGSLMISKLRDANAECPATGIIKSVLFHPSRGDLLLTASLDRSMSLFHIDGKANAHVHSVVLEDMPVSNACWSHDGRDVWATGRRPYWYIFDAEACKLQRITGLIGREERAWSKVSMSPDGQFFAMNGASSPEVLIVSTTSKQIIGSVRSGVAGPVESLAWKSDSSALWTTSTGGAVFEWDSKASFACSRKWRDEGCIHSSSMTSSLDGKYIATGSDSGIVNVYTGDAISSSSSPSPLKAIMNITTRIDGLQFNRDSQLLATWSHQKRDLLRMVHLPSCTVFANWPMAKTTLGSVSAVDFSANGGFLAVANDQGRCQLYRLLHWPSA